MSSASRTTSACVSRIRQRKLKSSCICGSETSGLALPHRFVSIPNSSVSADARSRSFLSSLSTPMSGVVDEIEEIDAIETDEIDADALLQMPFCRPFFRAAAEERLKRHVCAKLRAESREEPSPPPPPPPPPRGRAGAPTASRRLNLRSSVLRIALSRGAAGAAGTSG